MAVTTVKTSKPVAKKNAAKQPAKPSKASEKVAIDQHTGTPVANLHPAARPDYASMTVDRLHALYTERFSAKAAKNTSIKALANALTTDTPLNKSHAKAHATALYVKAMKCEPTKSWDAETILAAIKDGRLPGQRNGGTASAARKLISAACLLLPTLTVGKETTTLREAAKGRSAWKAEEVHAFVAKYRLKERIAIIDIV